MQIQQQTRKLSDLAPQLAGLLPDDRKFLSGGDIAASTYNGQVLMMPFQRVITGWGARKIWLAKVGEQFPLTWDDALRVGKKFQENDPEGTGQKNTYGMAMQGGDPSSIIDAGISILTYRNGVAHSLVDDAGNLVTDQPENARVTIEYLKLYTTYKLLSPETVNQIFTHMYQLIEGGRVGMFRVGNWNVGKWDKQPPGATTS